MVAITSTPKVVSQSSDGAQDTLRLDGERLSGLHAAGSQEQRSLIGDDDRSEVNIASGDLHFQGRSHAFFRWRANSPDTLQVRSLGASSSWSRSPNDFTRHPVSRTRRSHCPRRQQPHEVRQHRRRLTAPEQQSGQSAHLGTGRAKRDAHRGGWKSAPRTPRPVVESLP